MKKKLILPAVMLALFAVFLYYHNLTVSGEKVLEWLDLDNYVATVTIEREIVDDPSGFAFYTFTEDEIEEFYTYFKATEFKDIGTASFPVLTKIRYYVMFYDKNEFNIVWMKFYEADALIVDRIYRDKPSPHGRYTLVSSDLKQFFDKIFKDL